MKFICNLPEQKHYLPLQSATEGKYIWQDKASSILRIVAPVPDPWRQEWVVMPSLQKAKNTGSIYPSKLDLKCFRVERDNSKIPKGTIFRELMRGKFAYSQNSPAIFFCFPIEANENTYYKKIEQQWLLYSIYQI